MMMMMRAQKMICGERGERCRGARRLMSADETMHDCASARVILRALKKKKKR